MSVTIADLAVFGETPSEEFTIRPDADRILAGLPDQTAWNFFTDQTGQFSAGIWEGAPGVWRVNFTENEFCHLMSGVVVVRDEAGGNRMQNLTVVLTATFPAGADGDRARDMLPRALRQSHDRLCTVSRTVEHGSPVSTVEGDPTTVPY